jgi:hypothetical protein
VNTLLWDLSNRPASFDFITCLSSATTLGADHVRFVLKNGWKKKNYSITQAQERFRSIVEPAVGLWGLGYSIGDREGVEVDHFFTTCMEVYRRKGFIKKIPVKAEPKDYVTITLRNSRTPERNSKDDEWLEFASRLDRKAIILRDYEERPLDLVDRMRLYANAHMNFFVINGPVTLCIHSEAPYLCMRTIGCENSGSTSPQFMRQIGITPGFQFPWANRRQRLSYLDDTVDNIEAEYMLMEEQLKAAA